VCPKVIGSQLVLAGQGYQSFWEAFSEPGPRFRENQLSKCLIRLLVLPRSISFRSFRWMQGR
jgi:hypothetical protein